MKGYSQLRKGRMSNSSTVYHLTFATDKRIPYFENFYRSRAMIKALKHCDDKGWSKTVAFVVMPDHIHWLVQPAFKDISELVRVVKEFTFKHYQIRWQRNFYDRGMRSDEEMIETARYIIANPKRATMVNHVGQYSHWDCTFL
ncbi:REP-associated tyrosine transposase [Marinomonas aquimarina]|nr:transposase [Marinomonas aquimarina]